MDTCLFDTYLPLDRRHALAAGRDLPDRAEGAVLLADVSGFTPLADALAAALGPRRGAEELARLLNATYDALIAQVHRYGGSVVSFVGDGLVCWFEGDTGLRAATCGMEMHQAAASIAAAPVADAETISLSMKAGVAAGPVRRFLVGRPHMDLLAGAALHRVAQAEEMAQRGELVAAPEIVRVLGHRLDLGEGRDGFAVVVALASEASPTPWSDPETSALSAKQLQPYLLPPVYERLVADQSEFLAALRPAVALFLRFAGLDYERDDAGVQLDAFVRRVQGVLARYEGHLLQLTAGDKGSFVYAAFGALAAHEDDAARAVSAAVALRQIPAELDFITGLQIGLSQGRVRAGAYGSRTRRAYGVIGPEAIVACRLMEAAPLGEVWCSPAIQEAAGDRWTFEPLEPVRLKGKTEPLPVYRPMRQTSGRATRAAGTLIGRRTELETLTRLLSDARLGQRRVLLLEGEAGIGKSRLLAELKQMAQRRGVAWLEGAGQSIEQGTPYRAWRDVLAAYFCLDQHQGQAEQCHRVQEQVASLNPALAERGPLLNDVLRLDLPETNLTQSFDPKLRHESLTALIIDLLRVKAAEGPLTLVFEDGHWMDSLSWEMALSVARTLNDQPLLLVVALRPLEEPDPAKPVLSEAEGHTVLVGLADAEVLLLDALPPDQTVALAAARLGVKPEALPLEVAELVRERAGGNPFFAEELAHVLRETDAVVVQDGACGLTGDVAALQKGVPDTVEGVVLARIDRLPLEQQLTLKVAAVIGRSFLYRTLQDVHPRRVLADLLRAQLDNLEQRDLTLVEALEPELSYLFKHVITQQVAYDTLLFSRRRELHRAVARWYERVYAENLRPYYPLLAHHWSRAEDAPREQHYARLAGEQAAAQYANAEALRYLNRALELTPDQDLEERYTLLMTREKVYDLLGQREAQSQDLDALNGLAQVLPDDVWRAEAALRQANYANAISDYSVAIAATREAVRLGQRAQDTQLEAEALRQWARALERQGEYQAAHGRYEEALALARGGQLRQLEARILRNLGAASSNRGQGAQSRSYLEQALDVCRQIGDRLGESQSLTSLGTHAWGRGDYAEAKAYLDQALIVTHDISARRNEATLLNSLGSLFSRRCDYATAGRYHEQALNVFREIGDREGEGVALVTLSIDAYCQGDIGRARSCAEQARRICRETGTKRFEGWALSTLGRLSAHQGDYAEASACLEEALRISREIGDQFLESLVLHISSLLAHHCGDDQKARELSQQALLIAQKLDNNAHKGNALTTLGHALVGLGHLDEAADVYREAVTLRRELEQRNMAMEPLAGLARVSLLRGNPVQARTWVEDILEHLETRSLDGAEDPFSVYLTCCRVLEANGDPRAREFLGTAYHLLQERAARVGDEDLRHSFMETVTAHREIVQAWEGVG